jgi:ribonuclease D
MEHLSDDIATLREPRAAFLRMKRVTSLTRRQLGVAREVCAWREQLAARRDVPRKRILSDEVCLEICKRVPTGEQALRRIRQTEQLGSRDAAAICAAVEKALALPLDELPRLEHHDRPTQEQESIIDLMYALLRVISARTGIAVQVIATRDDLLEFIQSKETSRLATSWRYEVAGRYLERLLSGEIGLTVKGSTIELL